MFASDRRLQACLVDHAAHVTPGCEGFFVALVQYALVLLDGARIDGREMQAMTYGPTTARAVLTYKTRRNIVNHSYQQSADDIVGKMTIAALDREMATYERMARR
ncbi:peptidoglycan-binding domain-containing protein [Oleomonas cavernae]|uniref:peptidoglycan-binding domain-containing protein n=1 Tax=Oleomonas cavernae TaxID=2320859 RepID=UPI0011C3F1F7|nr:hypothetical protein [Oleomonas cavernae]